MWHASVAYQSPIGLRPILMLSGQQRIAMWRIAEGALVGVGDAVLGEFREKMARSLHIKRRLTAEEWGERPWGMDYRKTPEGVNRIRAIALYLPEQFHADLLSEVS